MNVSVVPAHKKRKSSDIQSYVREGHEQNQKTSDGCVLRQSIEYKKKQEYASISTIQLGLKILSATTG